MAKSYNQYCPIAHALDLVGERWSLLVIRELLAVGPLRYSDLHCRLAGCGTNILAARLKELERGGVVRKRRLPPPAASTVYELTEFGESLRPVMHQLAHWGARSLGPPPDDVVLGHGWLTGALKTALLPNATDASVEFRIGGETVSLVKGQAQEGSCDHPAAVVEGDAAGLYHLLVDRDLSGLTIRGDRAAVSRLLDGLPHPTAPPARVETEATAAA